MWVRLRDEQLQGDKGIPGLGAGLQELSLEGDLILYYVWDVAGDGRKFLELPFSSVPFYPFCFILSSKKTQSGQAVVVCTFIYLCLFTYFGFSTQGFFV